MRLGIRLGMGLWAVCLGAALSGCLGAGEYTPLNHFTLMPTPAPAAQTATETTLGVFDLEYVRVYKEPIAARVAPHELTTLDTDVWAELPNVTVTRALVDSLGASGQFATVANAVEMERPDWVLSGELRRFEWLRETAPGAALCEVSLQLRPRGQDTPYTQIRLREEVPLTDDSPGALAAAMEQAIKTIAERAAVEAAAGAE